MRITTTLLIFLLLIGCKKKDPEVNIGVQFQQYVDRFVDEAALRGITIDFSDTGLSIVFRKAVDTESSGVCRGNHEIEIEKIYWDGLNDSEREGLIFHELGHCELDRRHRNDLLSNGEWVSRMRGNPIPEGESAVINYSGSRRAYYIEELFDENIAEPDWVNIRAEYNDAQRELISESNDLPDFEQSLGLSFSEDFEIEVVIDIQDNTSWMGFAWGGNAVDDELYVAYNGSKNFIIGSGLRVWGTMFQALNFELLNDRVNKITLRRQGEFYYVFVNEEFVYWFDFAPLAGARIRSIVGSQSPPNFREIRVYRLTT